MIFDILKRRYEKRSSNQQKNKKKKSTRFLDALEFAQWKESVEKKKSSWKKTTNSLMLPKSLRLPSKQKLSNPQRMQTDFFSISFLPNNTGVNRYGIVVSKKIDKRAVVRNRLKRVLRSIVEELHIKLPQGNDILFVVKRNFQDISREEILKTMQNSIQKL